MTGRKNSPPGLTALVLAASRQGVDDPVARIQNKSHKCLVEVDGIPMIERVIGTLIESGNFSRVLVSIENEVVLGELVTVREWLQQGVIEIVPSAGNLGDSLINLAENDSGLLPMVITTADNALHNVELVNDFVAEFTGCDADVVMAVTDEVTVLKDYPDAGIGFFRFSDGGYSFCNLFGIHTKRGLGAARVFRTGGQFRKHPMRILEVFGIVPLVLYKLRLVSLSSCFELIGKKLGISINKILLQYPFGPIDIDNLNSYSLTETTLRKRKQVT